MGEAVVVVISQGYPSSPDSPTSKGPAYQATPVTLSYIHHLVPHHAQPLLHFPDHRIPIAPAASVQHKPFRNRSCLPAIIKRRRSDCGTTSICYADVDAGQGR